MKNISLTFILLFLTASLFAQRKIEPTNELQIFGLVDSAITISYEKICAMKTVDVGDLILKNQEGEFKKEYKNVKGVALLDILNKINISTAKPKELNTYYFVFTASDGYAVVFSWNEIFNSDIGKSSYVIIEANDKKLSESDDRILLMSTKDFNLGRRHIKGLKTIEVKKI